MSLGSAYFDLIVIRFFIIIIILEKGISLKYFFQTFSDFLRLLEKKSDFFRLNLVFQTFSDSVAALHMSNATPTKISNANQNQIKSSSSAHDVAGKFTSHI